MEWSRVKNILIVLLAIVNLFLFFVYFGTTMEDAKGEEELVSHTVSVLDKNGITISESVIPLTAPLLYPATGEVSAPIAGCTVEGGIFTLEAEGDLASLAKKAGISHGAIYGDAGGESAVQTVNGIPVYNGKLTCDGKKLSGVAVGNVKTLQGDEPQNVCGLLVSAAEWLPSGEIKAVSPGFFWSEMAEGTIYLLPVWQITHNQGVFYINAMTGERAEYLQK